MTFNPIVEPDQSITRDGALARSAVSDASRFNVGPGRALLPVVRDSREQRPYAFTGLPVEVEVGALATGDYSIRGHESKVTVERKSLGDLVHCLTGDRARFMRELERMRDFAAVAVVVESPQHALRTGRYLGGVNPRAAWQSALALMQRYRVPFIFCMDRADAEQVTFDILRHYWRDQGATAGGGSGRAGAGMPPCCRTPPSPRARTGATPTQHPHPRTGRADHEVETPNSTGQTQNAVASRQAQAQAQATDRTAAREDGLAGRRRAQATR